MKQRHTDAERLNARQVLTAGNIAIGQDFHTLSTSQVNHLLAEADRVRYQTPRNANGSRGRYFHDRLQRLAR
jgi:hypothetical protein